MTSPVSRKVGGVEGGGGGGGRSPGGGRMREEEMSLLFGEDGVDKDEPGGVEEEEYHGPFRGLEGQFSRLSLSCFFPASPSCMSLGTGAMHSSLIDQESLLQCASQHAWTLVPFPLGSILETLRQGIHLTREASLRPGRSEEILGGHALLAARRMGGHASPLPWGHDRGSQHVRDDRILLGRVVSRRVEASENGGRG